MAFEADCGVSTVLEALGVESTTRLPMPEECWSGCHTGPRDEALSGKTLCFSLCPLCLCGFSGGWTAFRIPNSEFRIQSPFTSR